MKTITKFLLILQFVLLGFSSCSDNDNGITCNLAAGDTAEGEITLTFRATQTGDGTISTLTYQIGDQKMTVSNPTLPWQYTEEVPLGTSFSILATGKVTKGSLTVSYTGNGPGIDMEGSDFCSQKID